MILLLGWVLPLPQAGAAHACRAVRSPVRAAVARPCRVVAAAAARCAARCAAAAGSALPAARAKLQHELAHLQQNAPLGGPAVPRRRAPVRQPALHSDQGGLERSVPVVVPRLQPTSSFGKSFIALFPNFSALARSPASRAARAMPRQRMPSSLLDSMLPRRAAARDQRRLGAGYHWSKGSTEAWLASND